MNSIMLVFQKAGQILWTLWPYILGGVLLGEILKLTSWTKLIFKGVSRSPLLSVFVASLLGMLSPLCTYGTIPVMLQLCRAGVHISPLVTFLASSSLMNPQLFIVTWGGLGLEMAMVRAGAVLIFGLLLGFVLYRVPLKWVINPNISEDKIEKEEVLQRPSKVFRWKTFARDSWETLQFVGFYMVLGTLLGAVVEVFMPSQLIMYLFKPGRWMSVFLAGLMGMPLYACGGGTIPLIRSFIEQGMSKGAALAFFLVGPATRITPLMALTAILRPCFVLAYVILLIIFSLAAGLIYH